MSERWRYLSSRRRLPTSISSPRREWWSLRCSRRCSVSSLMRAVSSATWTSVEPVSASPRPYSATISRFLSAVSVIEPETVAAVLRSLAPAPVAADDLALEQERSAQQRRGGPDVARGDQPADVARRDRLPLQLDERHDARLELVARA